MSLSRLSFIDNLRWLMIMLVISMHAAWRQSWLTSLTKNKGRRWGLFGLIGGLVFWCILLIAGGAFTGKAATYTGGLFWQIVIATLSCITLTFGLATLLRKIPGLKQIL